MEPDETVIVEGLVVRSGSREPLKKARVSLKSGSRSRPLQALTDAAGRFLLTHVEPGHCYLSVECNGYIRQAYGQPGPFGSHTLLVLEPGRHVRDIVFELTPAAVITGHVLDGDGDPVGDVQVQALRFTDTSGGPQMTPVGSSMTNDLGEYRIWGLLPGRYVVGATYSGGMGSGDRSGAYYPSAKDPNEAASIELAPGEEIRRVDIVLLPIRTFGLRGRVVPSEKGGPVSRVMVRLCLERPDPMSAEGSHSFTEDDGRFEFWGVTPGDYRITAQLHAAGDLQSGAQEWVRVEEADVDGIELVLTTGLEVRGRFRVDGDLPESFTGWHVILSPHGPMPMLNGPVNRQGEVAPDGSVLFQGLFPGFYSVSACSPDSDCYLKSVRLGDRAVPATGFKITSKDSTVPDLDLVLASDGGRIDGMVSDDQDRPHGGVSVVLVPKLLRPNQHHFRGSSSDQDGRFAIRGIPPGEYFICAGEILGSVFADLARTVESTQARVGFAPPQGLRPPSEWERDGLPCSVKPASRQTVSLRLRTATPAS